MPEATPHAAIPPIIDPKGHEAFPTFRETFMVYVTDPTANAAIRGFGILLFDLLLNSWGEWPKHPEGIFRADLRAVIADLRCAQGSLLELTGDAFSPETPHGRPPREHRKPDRPRGGATRRPPREGAWLVAGGG